MVFVMAFANECNAIDFCYLCHLPRNALSLSAIKTLMGFVILFAKECNVIVRNQRFDGFSNAICQGMHCHCPQSKL